MPPIYGYRCQSLACPYCGKAYADADAGSCCKETVAHGTPCGHESEVFFTSVARAEAEEPSEACPVCGGLEKRRLVAQGTTHILKGKGWFYSGGY